MHSGKLLILSFLKKIFDHKEIQEWVSDSATLAKEQIRDPLNWNNPKKKEKFKDNEQQMFHLFPSSF